MIFLLLAIVCSAALPLLFRAFDDWRVNLFWAIPANYLACIVVGGIFAPPPQHASELLSQPWLILAILQGLVLAVNFYLLAYTAQRAGVSVAVLASRLSVAIPGDPGFRPLWRFVECREDRRLGNRPIVALSVYGDQPGFWRYSGMVASTAADSRVPHVRVSLYPAEVHAGALSRQFLQSPVCHDVFSIRFRDKCDGRAR